jgi:hypothetical protein
MQEFFSEKDRKEIEERKQLAKEEWVRMEC